MVYFFYCLISLFAVASENVWSQTQPAVVTPIQKKVICKQLRDYTFNGDFIFSPAKSVKLKDGKYDFEDSDAPLHVSLDDKICVFADLNADTEPEVIVALIVRGGGTGAVHLLKVFEINNLALSELASGPNLGDRVFIKKIWNDKKGLHIIKDVFDSKDPACCPSKTQTISLVISGSTLIEKK